MGTIPYRKHLNFRFNTAFFWFRREKTSRNTWPRKPAIIKIIRSSNNSNHCMVWSNSQAYFQIAAVSNYATSCHFCQQRCWWQEDVVDNIWILVSHQWWQNSDEVRARWWSFECWWPKSSLTSQSYHQHISSPTSMYRDS